MCQTCTNLTRSLSQQEGTEIVKGMNLMMANNSLLLCDKSQRKHHDVAGEFFFEL